MIPTPAETTSVTIILYDDSGQKTVAEGIVSDQTTIRPIYDCLVPNESSTIAAEMMVFPVIGKVGFSRNTGSMMWVEFIYAGKNPLCFRAGKAAYVRGGTDYASYQTDHKRLYDVDSEHVDEGMLFHRKLEGICDPNKKPTETDSK